MEGRKKLFFVSDVHLGLDVKNPAGREARFVSFLKSIPAGETTAIYLLGDIWDFWYEYRDVVPKGYVRVFSALMDLMDAGVDVFFIPGNHDIWCYGYFESLGMKIISQPHLVEAAGKVFCLGHGDGLGLGRCPYRFMNSVFKNHVAQSLFSLLHPWLAFRLGRSWSHRSRLSRGEKYVFKGASEPLYQWAETFAQKYKVDYFIFGHLHARVDEALPSGARLMILPDWLDDSQYLKFDGISVGFGHSMNTE